MGFSSVKGGLAIRIHQYFCMKKISPYLIVRTYLVGRGGFASFEPPDKMSTGHFSPKGQI